VDRLISQGGIKWTLNEFFLDCFYLNLFFVLKNSDQNSPLKFFSFEKKKIFFLKWIVFDVRKKFKIKRIYDACNLSLKSNRGLTYGSGENQVFRLEVGSNPA
jgi:hypothetical protein